MQTAFSLNSISLKSFSQLSTLNDNVLITFVYEAPQSDVQKIRNLTPAERIARSSEEMDGLAVVTEVSVPSKDKNWWETSLDWVQDNNIEVAVILGVLLIYCAILAVVCSTCYQCGQENSKPPPPHGPPPTQAQTNLNIKSHSGEVPSTRMKPHGQDKSLQHASPVEHQQDGAFTQLFKKEIQPGITHEIEMEEFYEKEKQFFPKDSEEVFGDLAVGDIGEIFSKSTQRWEHAKVFEINRDGRITMTYEVNGVQMRKKVRRTDPKVVRFRNSG